MIEIYSCSFLFLALNKKPIQSSIILNITKKTKHKSMATARLGSNSFVIMADVRMTETTSKIKYKSPLSLFLLIHLKNTLVVSIISPHRIKINDFYILLKSVKNIISYF